MTEFFFNFKDLTNIQNPNKVMLNASSLIISDDYVKKLFPKRYNFYMKFVDGFSSPSNLYKYLYTTKESKDYYEELQNKLAKVSNALLKLSNNNKKKVIQNLQQKLNNDNYSNFFNVINDVASNDGNKGSLKGGGGDGNEPENKEEATTVNPIEEQQKEIKNEPPLQSYHQAPNIHQHQVNKSRTSSNIDEDYSKDYYVKKPFKPMETFLNDVKKIAPVLNFEPPKNIDDLIKKKDINSDVNYFNVNTTDISEKTDKLQQLYNNYLKNPLFSPERLDVNIYDRLTFIGITYIIRFLTLQFIYWCLNSNIINNFSKAYFYYTIIYIIFFIFITSIVNVMYFYPIMDLFSNISNITVFPNYLYYFYVYTNGYLSLLIHLFIILILLFIPFVLTMDRKNNNNNNDLNISYDYKKKNEIYISISNFSLIIWVLTSIISLKF